VSQELKGILFTAGKSEVEAVKEYLLSQLKVLQKNGDIALDQDKNLTGLLLELCVYQLFQQAGLNIYESRTGQEDFLIIAEENDEFKV